MNHSNTHSILKISCWFYLFMGLFFSYCPLASAITTNRYPHSALKTTPTSKEIQRQTKPIYLLNWQENKIITTAGVFILDDDIEIIDRNSIKETMSLQQKKRRNPHKLHRIIIKKAGRKIVRITIK